MNRLVKLIAVSALTISTVGSTTVMLNQPATQIQIAKWSPVNKIDNLNRDFFVLCHD